MDPHTNFVYMAKDDVYTVSVINGIRTFDRLDSSSIYRTISNVTVGSGPFNTWPRDFAFSLLSHSHIASMSSVTSDLEIGGVIS